VSCPAEFKENERGNCYETLEVWAAPDALLNNELLSTSAIDKWYLQYTQRIVISKITHGTLYLPVTGQNFPAVSVVTGLDFPAVSVVTGLDFPAVSVVTGLDFPAVSVVTGLDFPAVSVVTGLDFPAGSVVSSQDFPTVTFLALGIAKTLWLLDKLSRYQQWDFLFLIM
jgi:hypothetical protein